MHAYFDDAKSFGRSNNVLLAGYLADEREWEALAREWRMLLHKHHMQRLHTSDFLSGNATEYKETHGNLKPPERVAIVTEFIEPIRKHILCGFVVAVDAAAWREMMKARPKKPSPEEFCFIRVMRSVMEEMNRWTDPFPLTLTFDDSEHSMRFYRIYRDRKERDSIFASGVSGIAFADDSMVAPLQAADLLASVTSRESHKQPGTWMADSPFQNILNATDPAFGKLYRAEYWDQESLKKYRPNFMRGAWHGVFPLTPG